MIEEIKSFNIQNLSVNNDEWKVELNYESFYAESKNILKSTVNTIIELDDSEYRNSNLKLMITDKDGDLKTCLVSGIDGVNYLHLSDAIDKSQTVKLYRNTLIISLGFTLLSIDIQKLKLNWKIKPDLSEIFEFYDLEEDILLRGEIGIHRINKSGNIKWTFSARDIWVNTEGKEEVNIESNKIRLFDFESNEYLIDFNGKLLEDIPKQQDFKKLTLFNNPKQWLVNKIWKLNQNRK